MSKISRQGEMVITDSENMLRQELILQGGEHIPFLQVICLNALEDVRRSISTASDGGLASLLALWTVLPSAIRDEFQKLPREINYYSRVRYVVHHSYRRSTMRIKGSSIPRLEYSPESGRIEEKFESDKTVSIRSLKATKVGVVDVTPRSFKRQFVIAAFVRILDCLEEAGLLTKSRAEIVGGDL